MNLSARVGLPFLFVIVIVAVATICAAVLQLPTNIPLSPWESSVAMEAVRLNSGLPVYESGHATHMYGPLLNILFAMVFRIFGLSFPAARIAMSIFALALAVFLSAILCRGKNRDLLIVAVFLFLGINLRTNIVFFSIQPDCVAALLGVVGLYFWIRQRYFVIAIALFIAAALFKQTSAAFALIPIVHALIWQRRDLAKSLIPTMSILLALAAIRFIWPQMFAAIVTVPGSIKVYPGRALGLALYLLGTFPLFFIALLSILRAEKDERARWILSALVVLLPVSIWTICKSGGSYNSFLPAYLAMTALFVVRLDAIKGWLGSLSIPRSILAASGIALAILLSFFVQFDRAVALLFARSGDDKYEEAVQIAQRLNAISPQDPTIAYRARGYFGRSLFFELDAHAVDGNWPRELPMSILPEIEAAGYIIAVRSYVPTPVFENSLAQHGFNVIDVPELAGSAYTVWGKAPQ